jgi:hypothetical protein
MSQDRCLVESLSAMYVLIEYPSKVIVKKALNLQQIKKKQ